MQIPNICHFVFGLQEQTEAFLFCHYLAVYSCYVINRPDHIHFHYHYEPYGLWWQQLKALRSVRLHRIALPTHFGAHLIEKTAHRADHARMHILHRMGGVYLDIDTICIRPWHDLRKHQVVLGREHPNGICNAIMMTVPRSPFFSEWLAQYPQHFKPRGWREASIVLPETLARAHPTWLTLQTPDAFFLPNYTEVDKIFEHEYDIPPTLVALHLWESFSSPYMQRIHEWDWADRHPHTLYGRAMRRLRNAASGAASGADPAAASPVLHIIHRRDATNTGDMMSSCANYYSFPGYRLALHDIYQPQWHLIAQNDPIIFSGGGLLDCLDAWNKNINTGLALSDRVFGWGIGFNRHRGTTVHMPLTLSKFRLLGVRDHLETAAPAPTRPTQMEHVPCSVCKHPLLHQLRGVPTVRHVGVCEHIHHPIADHGDAAKITNGRPMEELARFIAESQYIITNSYHGTYLSILLRTPVILHGEFSQKFDLLPYPVTRTTGDMTRDMQAAAQLNQAHGDALETSCQRNDAFYEKVMTCLADTSITPS